MNIVEMLYASKKESKVTNFLLCCSTMIALYSPNILGNDIWEIGGRKYSTNGQYNSLKESKASVDGKDIFEFLDPYTFKNIGGILFYQTAVPNSSRKWSNVVLKYDSGSADGHRLKVIIDGDEYRFELFPDWLLYPIV